MVEKKHPVKPDDTPPANARKKSRSGKRSKKAAPAGQTKEPASAEKLPTVETFPIIGIGASAGGLETFEKFFTHMPPDSGMAFVLVQHLDPTHESMLVDLIKRYTRMQVFQVEDGLAIKPNCIYIIPPQPRYGPAAGDTPSDGA